LGHLATSIRRYGGNELSAMFIVGGALFAFMDCKDLFSARKKHAVRLTGEAESSRNN